MPFPRVAHQHFHLVAAALHPLGVVASSIFVAVIYIGADSMSRAINISN